MGPSNYTGGWAPPRPARYDSTADANLLIDEALRRAGADGKRLMLEFGADWCVDCHVLDTLFASPTIRKILDESFHLVKIDVGFYRRNMEVDERYGRPTRGGIPAFVILSPRGEVITTTSVGRRTWMEVQGTEVRAAGPLRASPATTSLRYEPLGLTFPVYPPGPVTLRLPIQLTQPRGGRIPVLVSYMACSESVCLPPVIDSRLMVTVPAFAR